jgi:hypothetical protein
MGERILSPIKVTVFQKRALVREGLEVWLHWAGFFSGISKFRTEGKGRIFIEDDLINGRTIKPPSTSRTLMAVSACTSPITS